MRPLLIAAMTVLVLAASCSSSDDGSGVADADPETSATTTTGSDATPGSPETTAAAATQPADSVAFAFTVDGVTGGSNVPVEFTCDGANETPAVNIDEVPADVEELALIVDDPDAPTDSPFVHWLVYGIAPGTTTVTDGDTSFTYGATDAGTDEWFGPCPPPGDGLHTYRWRLFGLSSAMALEAGLDGRALEAAIADAVVADALLIASYERAG